MTGRIALLLSLCLAVPIGGCDDDDASEADEGQSTGPGTPPKLQTPDGYEVVMASEKAQKSKGRSGGDDDNLVREPTEPDPHGGTFTLEEAVEGLPTDGQLVAEIDTDLGVIFCDLFAEKTPKNVANFIGLARGKRQWWNAEAGAWVERRYYDGTTFHRVIPDYLIQGGDYLGDGTGRVGYTVEHEPHPNLRHDEAGLLCMASHEDGNGAQFFITDGPTTKLDGEDAYTIIGECEQTDVVERIARVPQSGRPDYRPLTPVRIDRLFVRRIEGGAEKAERKPPKLPEGVDMEDLQGRGASHGPAGLRAPREERGSTPEPGSKILRP